MARRLPNPEHVAAILATSKSAGERYAEILGIKNYTVITRREQTEGLRVRAVVVTPAYLKEVEHMVYQAFKAVRMADYASIMSSAEEG